MELLGAKVNAVTTGTMVLKDAVNEAMSCLLYTSYKAVRDIDEIISLIREGQPAEPQPGILRSDFRKLFEKEAFCEMVELSLIHIWHCRKKVSGAIPDMIMRAIFWRAKSEILIRPKSF